MKPYEVEILVAQVGRDRSTTTSCTTSSTTAPSWTKQGCTVLGGQAEQIARGARRRATPPSMDSGAAIQLGAAVLAGPDDRRSPPTSSRSRCSTAPARAARSAASRAPSSIAILERPSAGSLPVAQRRRRTRRAPRSRAARPRPTTRHRRRRAARSVPASHQSVGAVERVVDLVDEQHERGVLELVVGHVDVDPGHVAHGQRRTGRRARRAAATSMPSRVEPGREHLGPERPVRPR